MDRNQILIEVEDTRCILDVAVIVAAIVDRRDDGWVPMLLSLLLILSKFKS